jgi:cell wall-associated NlpC family hydrolase
MLTIREQVIHEARSWLKTPYHHEARVKGHGVDCLYLLYEVFLKVGVIPPIIIEHYPQDWHFHRDDEKYLKGVLNLAKEIKIPQMGDVVLFKFGRCFSHGGLVVKWPVIIHSFYYADMVIEATADMHPLIKRERKFFDAIGDR